MRDHDTTKHRPAHPRWPRRGRGMWALLVTAWSLAALVCVTAYSMLDPVDYSGVGRLGWAAFLIGPRLLIVTVVACAVALFAWSRDAVAAAVGFVVVVVATFGMVFAPAFLVWRQAGRDHISLSLGEALSLRLAEHGREDGQSIVYATSQDGAKLELDVWPAAGSGAATGPLRPAVVKVHGGAWIAGSRSGHAAWNRWLNRLGYEVFDVEYRVPPRGGWLSEVGDVKCALGWVKAHAARYRVDPARISVMGYSAGGNLAMLAAYSAADRRLPSSCSASTAHVRSVINLYGPSDLSLLFRTSGSRRYIDSALERYVGGSPSTFPQRYRMLSPVHHVSVRTPPTITVLGTSDRLIPGDQAAVLDRALARAGVVHPTYLLPATDHGFDVDWHGLSTQIARSAIERFLVHYG